MSDYRLSDLLDMTLIQNMADAHYRAAGMPIGIVDAIDGSILVGSGWQDICVKFHRVNPISLQRCRKSDNYIKERLVPGEACRYKCGNGLWDFGVPIVVAGRHLATMFLGQFFYEGETPDREYFIHLADELGFPADEYLAALDRVPVFSREKVDYILEYNKAMVTFISELAGHALFRKETDKTIRESERKFHAIFDETYEFIGLLSVDGRLLETNKTALRFIGAEKAEVIGRPFWETPWWTHSPELQEQLHLAVEKTAKGEFVRFEATHISTDGNLHYVDFSLKPVKDEASKVVLLISEGRDITEHRRAEETVRRSEAELRSFVEKSPFGFFRTHVEEDRFLEVNPALLKMLGYDSPEELLSTKLTRDIYHDPQDREQTLGPLLRNGFNEIELQCKRKNGESITVRLSGRLVQESVAAGRVFEGIVEDVTERRRSEEALRESEEYFRSLFENMSEGYAYCRMLFDDHGHPEDFVYLDVNGAFGTLTGLVDVIGRKGTEVIPGIRESQPELFEIYGRVSLTGRPERFEIEVKPLAMWFSISVYSLEKEHFVAVFDVITNRKLAEQALRESEERFRRVVEGAPGGMYIQTDGIIRYLNPAALAMFGAESASQLVGRGYLEIIHPDNHAAVTERAHQVLDEKKVVPYLEERLLRLDGSVFDGEVTAVPFIFEGHSGALVFVTDITRRKQEEEKRWVLEQQLRQAQKMEAVGRLAGGIAHDFNNILMVIQSHTEMLQDSLPVLDDLRNNTEQVLKAAQRAASLTGQMLAFSRRQITTPAVLDLNAVVDETGKMLMRLIGEDIEFRVDAAESLWKISAGPDQIVQVLMNLCVNSRDAMPHGGTLTIATGNVTVTEGGTSGHPDVAPGEYVRLSVSDTGSGICKQEMEKIFEPFFTTKEVGKGTGLGLAMVYGIVKQSGGYVWADSEPGRGSCFTIYLPRAKGSACSGIPPDSDTRPQGNETILIAEDEEAVREAMCGYLRSLGYTALTANSGQQALTVASQQKRIDLLITDVVMPKMNGRELSQMLTSLRPGLKTIYMSGYTDDSVLRQGIHGLGTQFLQKPFSLGTLARKVRETLGRAETRHNGELCASIPSLD